ncbi:hypothetical protein L1987_54470 [Smallanthus sonchifolius]|uniref:Uncharacterized protein n=1 Tax=Smallanthus sonchifolius TaxID=185202 RepID=A0ACB9E780_9ASTR|nr:hypothetical protein L1987_54470 [Smallanthus sonchifolius]
MPFFSICPLFKNLTAIQTLLRSHSAKCLYDSIARMKRAAKKGKAIAEGVEKNWGTSFPGPNTSIETLREQILKPNLSTILSEKGPNTSIETLREQILKPNLSTILSKNSKIVTVSPFDTVVMATKKMLEFRSSSATVTIDNKP